LFSGAYGELQDLMSDSIGIHIDVFLWS